MCTFHEKFNLKDKFWCYSNVEQRNTQLLNKYCWIIYGNYDYYDYAFICVALFEKDRLA